MFLYLIGMGAQEVVRLGEEVAVFGVLEEGGHDKDEGKRTKD
jgi:hypothetical protein